jgi:surface antigen
MKIVALLAGSAAFAAAIALPAQAQYSNSGYNTGYPQPVRNTVCEQQRKDDKLAGGLAGAVVGGLIGGAIGNNIDGNDDKYRRGYRGHRGYRGRDYRRHGYRGHGYRNKKSSNDGEVIVGALLGAVVGGIAGSELAGSSQSDCKVYTPPRSSNTYPVNSIPRSTDGLYGGEEVMNAPRPVSSYPRDTTTTYPVRTSRTTARATYPVPDTPGPRAPVSNYPPHPIEGNSECRTVYSETTLPNGEIFREPNTACRNASGTWTIQDGTIITEDELY